MDGQNPIDRDPMPPPQTGTDFDTITADIESALRVALNERITRIADESGIGKRRAALIVVKWIREG